MERQIEQSYIKNGQVQYTYKYFPVVDMSSGGTESHYAAQAAECANQQGRFWEYHDKLFDVWSGENVGTYAKPKLKQYAADLKLDTGKFNTCLDTDQTLPVVLADVAEANKLNLQGTPTFLANGQQMRLRSIAFSDFARLLDPLFK